MRGSRDLYTLTQSVQGWRKPALPITRSGHEGLKSVEVAHVAKDLPASFLLLLMCVSQRPLLESKCPCVEKLQLLSPVVLAGNKHEYLARLVWWEKRGSAPLSIFALCVWIWGTEQVFGGTQARETTECYCLGTSVSEMTINLPLQLTGSYFQ